MDNEDKIVIEGVLVGAIWDDPSSSLVDRMISWEAGFKPPHPDIYQQFWQELIDRGICWSTELPRVYARTAATMLRDGFCKKPRTTEPPSVSSPQLLPEGWDKSDFLIEPTRLGYDSWDRPPMHEDWGRPFRWKQLRKELVRTFKQNKRAFEKNGDLPPPPKPKGCCKKKRQSSRDGA